MRPVYQSVNYAATLLLQNSKAQNRQNNLLFLTFARANKKITNSGRCESKYFFYFFSSLQ